MKKINVSVKDDGSMTIDLGGDLDRDCCGGEAQRLNAALKRLGVELELAGIHCRLPVSQRVTAKINGECNSSLQEVAQVYFSSETARLHRAEEV